MTNAAWDLSFDEVSSGSSGALLGGRGLAKAEGGLKFEQLKRQLVTYPSVPAIVLARLVSEIDIPGGSLVGHLRMTSCAGCRWSSDWRARAPWHWWYMRSRVKR